MVKVNEHYKQLQDAYLFSTVAKKTAAFKEAHPEADIIKMGIGDVSLPLCEEVISAMHKAVDEDANQETFVGYLMESGCGFLKEAIKGYYKRRNVSLDTSEIFISDGAKSDLANICDLFEQENKVLVLEPVYPPMWIQIRWQEGQLCIWNQILTMDFFHFRLRTRREILFTSARRTIRQEQYIIGNN